MAELPARIGPYEVRGRLGIGGMAETFVAVRRGPAGFAQRVCLKVIRRDQADDPEQVRQFLAEAALVARLRHAAITQVLDFGQDGTDYYLALELIDGMDLAQLLASAGPLPPDLWSYVALELSTALDFAHRAGGDASLGTVVHRDVSPSNTLISVEGEVKLSDFGIARPEAGPQHTRTGVVKGKVPYLAPEYARSGRCDARCDLFSLGALLYECASGERPHDGATELETLERAARAQHRPLGELVPAFPELLAAIVEQLLEPDPELRIQSAAALLEALSSLPPSSKARRELGQRVARSRQERPSLADLFAAELGSAPTELRDDTLDRGRPQRAAAPRTLALPPSGAAEPGVAGTRQGLRRGPKVALALALAAAASVAIAAALRGSRAVETAPAASVPATPAPAPGVEPAPAPAAAAAAPLAPASGGPAVGAPSKAPASKGAAARNATLEVVVLPYGGEVWIDGKLAGDAPLTLRLAPGSHEVEARTRDGTSERKVTLAAGERKQVVFR